VHFARYAALPAKKIWSWGVDEEGLDWRKALSDDNSGYVEVQAGLFRNQETYAFLEPRQSIRFSEYWMPVRQLDGISRANLAGVVSLTRRGNSLVAGLNANQMFHQATIRILDDKKQLFTQKADLAPQNTWTHELTPANPQTKYTIEVRDSQNALLIRQTEGEYDWTPESEIQVGTQPSYRFPDSDHRTSDDWIELGKELELNGKTLQARENYKEALRKYPESFELMKSAGRLAAALLRFDEAKSFLEQVHARDTSDPEISYYMGIASDGLDNVLHARTEYEEAHRVGNFRAAAGLRLGELEAREGNLKDAERYLEEAHRAAPNDIRLIEELAAIKIAGGRKEEGESLARQGLEVSPADYFLREELGEPDLSQLGNDANRVLRLAAEYMRLGLFQRAIDVLSRTYPTAPPDQAEPGVPASDKHPMIAYLRGYCREKLKQSPLDDYDAASKRTTAYVFPSTAEELTVLRAVIRTRPEDATAHYLLGSLYFSRGMTDSALEQWSQARKLNSRIPVLDASMGLALLHEKHDAKDALAAFREGLSSDPGNVTVYLGADQALSVLGSPASERVQILEKYPDLANAPTSLIFELILNLAEAGDFERAEKPFHKRFFPREEGGTNVRQVWIEVQLQKLTAFAKSNRCAEAVAIAERIGGEVPGLDFTRDGLAPIVDSARAQYLMATAYAACGKTQEAGARFQAASKASAPDQVLWAWQAAQKLPGFDAAVWQERLRSASASAEGHTQTSSFAGWWYYTAGALQTALGNKQEADREYQKAFLLPDRMMSYHCTRLARAENGR
jgi:tetratricopeptide (TPR) repeat protein